MIAVSSLPLIYFCLQVSNVLFRDCGIQDLRPKEATLGLLNDLLVDIVWWVVHDDSAVLAVNLGIQSRLPNQVDDPLLALIGVQAELGAQVMDVHPAEDLAVALTDKMAGGANEGICRRSQEEIAAAHLLRQKESLTSGVEVVGDVEGVDELGNRVGILVGLLANISNDILELLLLDGAVAGACATGDNGGDQVPQSPGAGCLDRIDIRGGEEHLQDGLASSLRVEKREQ